MIKLRHVPLSVLLVELPVVVPPVTTEQALRQAGSTWPR